MCYSLGSLVSGFHGHITLTSLYLPLIVCDVPRGSRVSFLESPEPFRPYLEIQVILKHEPLQLCCFFRSCNLLKGQLNKIGRRSFPAQVAFLGAER